MLDVFGTVEVTLGDGRRGSFVAEGDRLVFDVDEPASLLGLAGRRTLGTLSEALAVTGLTLHVRSGERTLLTAGHGVERGLLGRLFGLPRARLDRRLAIRSAFTRHRALP